MSNVTIDLVFYGRAQNIMVNFVVDGRLQLSELCKSVSASSAEVRSVLNHVWVVVRNSITQHSVCGDGAVLENTHAYEVHEYSATAVAEAESLLADIRHRRLTGTAKYLRYQRRSS